MVYVQKRHRADEETNRRKVEVLFEGTWRSVRWERLQVGDICRVVNNQFFPADLILLATSEPQSIAFLETSNLDGETNLKTRQASTETGRLSSLNELAEFRATLQCEPPNRHLYEFNGVLKETNNKSIPLGLEQILQRGAMLRNTAWAIAVVVYTGHETKLMKNSTKAPLKRSSIDRQTNTHILMLFLILIALSLLSAAFNELWLARRTTTDWYIALNGAQNANFGFNFLTFLILYNNLIPISLQVTAEIVRFFQAKFISMDSQMYHAETDTPALARTSNLNEELGMVRYVFSDKTGTLTCNQMEFSKCSIAEIIYTKPAPGVSLEESLLYHNLREHPSAPDIREFLTMLAVCHTVIPERVDSHTNYHAASPACSGDGRSVVRLGVRDPHAPERHHQRVGGGRRSSAVLRAAREIKLYCKGADSVIYPRLAGGHDSRYARGTLAHLEHFANEGLRTLVFAVADVPEHFYQEWSNTYHKACISLHNREEKIDEAAMLIENNMRLLGATAIEDKLQVTSLLKANINVWVLTGDKQETAINIAHSARLIHPAQPLLILNEDSLDGTREALSRECTLLGERLGKQTDAALVIDGTTLKYAMGCDLKKDFIELCISCKVVVCCRVSPIQKAEVVEMVASATGEVTLAIGDGANDVAMIQRASVGVGISGVEGLQAVCASDYSIAQDQQTHFILVLQEYMSLWFYNVIFTALPPFAIGLFDKICSPEIMIRHPVLYVPSQQGLLFNVRVFWVWAVNALLHSVLLFWLPVLMTSHHVLWRGARDGGYLVLGNFVYTAGLATHSWTWVTHVSIWGSIALWLLFILLYSDAGNGPHGVQLAGILGRASAHPHRGPAAGPYRRRRPYVRAR
ncbi:unnamed protein product [Leptidea sinapis]|uniref:P-type phospholipid transporter n=1 Tax=Leptidea sinapis TaxID=189913 RepID=A0A5E4PYS6_9NEOP|nr:unnamed protein product [Leptidea sinapis]